MLPFDDLEYCTGCGLCVNSCPVNCITMNEDTEGFMYPQINITSCIQCGKCTTQCPSNNKESETIQEQKCFAAWNVDSEIRFKSSSGGIFSAVALLYLKNNGVVYAAVLEDNKILHHIRIDKIEQLEEARKSKYFQSIISDIFYQIKKDVASGKKVLFVGTPCQVAAVKKMISSELLCCMDLICHGVTNQKVFLRYIQAKSKRYHSEISNVIFRTKEKSEGAVMKLEFKNGKVYYGISREDTYLRAFNLNLCLRKSCYSCFYANLNRVGDITIGDFWGLGENTPFQYSRKEGVSLVLVNSAEGGAIVKTLRDQNICKFVEREINEAMPRNRTLTRPMDLNKDREDFLKRVFYENFDRLIYQYDRHYYTKYYVVKLLRKIKHALFYLSKKVFRTERKRVF